MAKITFYGAAQTVTGSKYLLEAGKARVLIDCGLFQGLKHLRERNWKDLLFNPNAVHSVVLTHAHIDHSGYLPRLYKKGFRGSVYSTKATYQLCSLLLRDSAVNQQRDADYANRKGYSRHKPALPLYSINDAKETLELFEVRKRGIWHEARDPIYFRFHDAGHLLGSNMIEVEIRDRTPPLRLLFSGDVGRYDGPLYHDPSPPPACDYLICESTYGDRDHPEGDLLETLAETVLGSTRRGGVMLMSSFAIGRAQQLIYLLQVLMHDKRIPQLPIVLDSPMSCDATAIYRDHNQDHDLAEGQLKGRDRVLGGPHVHLTRSVEQSKALNNLVGPAVIISSSGMMTGGRILHHLKRRLPEKENTILLGGYMAAGTRGRALQDGAKTLRIHGRDVPVHAAVERLSGLSGHAGRSELLRWLQPLDAPRQTFLTHGELDSAQALSETLEKDRGWNVLIPELNQTVTFD